MGLPARPAPGAATLLGFCQGYGQKRLFFSAQIAQNRETGRSSLCLGPGDHFLLLQSFDKNSLKNKLSQ